MNRNKMWFGAGLLAALGGLFLFGGPKEKAPILSKPEKKTEVLTTKTEEKAAHRTNLSQPRQNGTATRTKTTPRSASRPTKLPTSLPRTKEIWESLEQNFPPASYSTQKFDAKLLLLSKLPDCLGDLLPEKGSVFYEVVYEVSEETLVGKVVDLTINQSDFNPEETAKFQECFIFLRESGAVDFSAVGYPEGGKMYSGGNIRFPIEDNFLYEFIRSNGEYLEGVPDGERNY